MSIGKKFNLILLSLICLVLMTSIGWALPIQVLEGGIPFADPQQLIDEGVRLGNSNYLREAWKHYEESLKLSEKYEDGYLELGKIYFHLSLLGASTEDEFYAAKNYVQVAIENNPEDPDAHRAMGLILAGRGAFIDAVDELTLALHLNPGNEYIICDLAALHLALHQPKKTISYLEGRNLKDGWSYLVLAMAWLQQNSKGRAILNLMKAKKLGYSGYWLKRAMKKLSKEVNLPLE